jgi:S1-C subfamily serine protease
MSRLLAVCALVFALWFPHAEAADWSNVVKILARSTVPLTCSGHNKAGCTAFSINSAGYYMTAYHCLGSFEGTGPDGLAMPEEPTLDGKALNVVFANEELDIAIVRAEKGRPALRYRTEPLEVGDEVAGYGYGYGFAVPIFRSAIVSTFVRDDKGIIWTFLDNSLVKGMSGGPIVDRQGRIVGINQSTDIWGGRTLSLSQIVAATQFWEPR